MHPARGGVLMPAGGAQFTVTASYLEIYKNTIYDLLNKEENRARSLSIHEDPQRGVFVANAIHEELTNSALPSLARQCSRAWRADTDLRARPAQTGTWRSCSTWARACGRWQRRT